MLRTLAASVGLNAELPIDPDQSGGTDLARVGGFTEAAKTVICSKE